MRKTFDDIIRRRWEGQEFPVDESHRRQMMELLEGKKKRRAFAFWWWGAGALVLVAGYLLWQTTATATQPNTATAAENATAISATPNPVTNAVPGTDINSSDKPVAITNSTDKSSVKQTEIINPSTNNSRSSQTKLQQSTSNSFQPSPSKIKPTGQSLKKQQGYTLQQVSSSPSSSAAPLITDDEILTGDESTKPEALVKTSPTVENTAVSSSSVNASVPVGSEVVTESSQAARPMLSIAWLDALPIEALLFNADREVGLIKPATRYKHPLYAFAEAGVGAILGSRPKYPSGWKVNAGAGIGYLLHPKLHLMMSGGYLVQDGGFDFERTSSQSSLSFAARSQINTLRPDRLHHLYGKVGLLYRIKKHHVGASFETQWLYGAQGSITIHTDDQLAGTSETTRYAWLSLDGFNRWHYNAGVQYGYRLTPHLNVAAGTQFYFSSLTRQDPALEAEGYSWKGNTAKVQPFITFNYLLYGPF